MAITVRRPFGAFTDDSTLLDSLGRNREAVGRAEAFLMDAHGHGKRGAEQLHAHAIALQSWHPSPPDALTVALACAIERERGSIS